MKQLISLVLGGVLVGLCGAALAQGGHGPPAPGQHGRGKKREGVPHVPGSSPRGHGALPAPVKTVGRGEGMLPHGHKKTKPAQRDRRKNVVEKHWGTVSSAVRRDWERYILWRYVIPDVVATPVSAPQSFGVPLVSPAMEPAPIPASERPECDPAHDPGCVAR